MSRKSVLVLLFVVIFVSLQHPGFQQNRVEASDGYPVHNLNTGLNYTTIQEAINSSETLSGHTILVDAGIYDEFVYITKCLTLIGENKSTTIVNGHIFVWANYSRVTQFTVQNGGIQVEDSHESTLSSNILKNNYIGIAIYDSSGNILKNNAMSNNTYNFDINSWYSSDFFQDIDSSNTIDEKPMSYLVNQHNQQVPYDAGYVALVNSTEIEVKSLNLKNNGMGVLLVNCTRCTVENVTSNDMDGIDMRFSSSNTLTNNTFTSSNYGFFMMNSDGNSIVHNRIHTDQGDGFWLQNSKCNILGYNIFSGFVGDGFFDGIWLSDGSNFNVITGNTVSSYYNAVSLLGSCNNTVYRNNFLVSHNQVCSNNFLDRDGEGNYYSTYVGVDSNKNGIGDSPYIVYESIDHYPLMGTFQSFNVSITPQSSEEVDVISNFTISNLGLYEWLSTPNQYLQAGQPFLRLVPVQEQNMTAGFCRMTLPNNILNTSEYIVLINMTPVIVNKLAMSNDTYTTLYFTFNSSALDGIIIVPEFPSFLVIPLFMVAMLLPIAIYERKHRTRAL